MSIAPLIASLSLVDSSQTAQPLWAVAAALGAISGIAGVTLVSTLSSISLSQKSDQGKGGEKVIELPEGFGQWEGGVDTKDVDTPDNWVPRHPSMIRLTGRHPFNSEAPITTLMAAAEKSKGLTPNSLHYVRNHGPVPNLEWADFNVSLDGWGPAAVSTAVWTGVPLSHILNLCGGPKSGVREDGTIAVPRYVNFSGSDNLPKGHYGTTVPLEMALDHTSDILLAYEMNGERLPPDHGYPLRVIIPGWIGGRMVKWLSKITVSDSESDSTYHFEDNRVLPPNVTSAAVALSTTLTPDPNGSGMKKVNWWRRPEFIINERNINSVITSPAHHRVVAIETSAPNPLTIRLPVKGYAYTGGGRRIIRVELSVDDGQTWILAPSLRHGSNDGAPRHGSKFWCWFLWEAEIDVLVDTTITQSTDGTPVQVAEVLVRCWDASQNTQPRDQTWNLLGMMSNNWYRVKLFHNPTTSTYIWQHPTNIGESKEAGWMPRLKAAADAATKPSVLVNTPAKRKEGLNPMTMADVASHKSETDCWIVIDGMVLDCTKFLKRHPGGLKSIMIVAGQDASEDFHAIHGSAAKAMKDKFAIGYIL
ncbi:hypothetical protein HDU93_007425 [Gonapodya sp. JEL0774]|nr:hypothetical protein HDU93_007425 [Gonapodya sp. JEL0774]